MYTGDNYAVWKTSRKPNKTYNTMELLILLWEADIYGF